MFDFETTVVEIEYRIRRLLADMDNQRVELDAANNQIRCLQEQITEQNKIINDLKEQNNILKLGNTLTQKGDSVEIKLKINNLIRNIDRSLALLNKPEQTNIEVKSETGT